MVGFATKAGKAKLSCGEDGEKGQLPVFTDKIWAAGLKAHAWSLENHMADL